MSRKIDDKDKEFAQRRDVVLPDPETTEAFNYKYSTEGKYAKMQLATYNGYNERKKLGHMDVSALETETVYNPAEKYGDTRERETVTVFGIKSSETSTEKNPEYVLDGMVKITESLTGKGYNSQSSIVVQYKNGIQSSYEVMRDYGDDTHVLKVSYNLDGSVDEVYFNIIREGGYIPKEPSDWQKHNEPEKIEKVLPITEKYKDGKCVSVSDGSFSKKVSSGIKSMMGTQVSEIWNQANHLDATGLMNSGNKMLEKTISNLLPKGVTVDFYKKAETTKKKGYQKGNVQKTLATTGLSPEELEAAEKEGNEKDKKETKTTGISR